MRSDAEANVYRERQALTYRLSLALTRARSRACQASMRQAHQGLVLLHIRLRGRLPAEHAAAAIGMRHPAFLGDIIIHRRPLLAPLDPPRLIVQPPDRGKLLLAAEPGIADGGFQHADGLVVDLQRHGEGMPVLAAMGER